MTQLFQASPQRLTRLRRKLKRTEVNDKRNAPVTSKDRLNVRSEKILDLVDEILLNALNLMDLPEYLVKNV